MLKIKIKYPAIIGCAGILVVLIMLIVIGVIWLFSGPEGGVRLPNEMEVYAQEYLSQHMLFMNSEKLLAYYDMTMSLDGSEAAILTTKRLIYHNNGRNTVMNLSDIEDIRHRKMILVGDIFEISAVSGEMMKIEISPLNQGDIFKRVLMAAWEKASKQKAVAP